MASGHRIALVHATPVAVAPIAQAVAAGWPEAEAVNLLDESLGIDRARAAELTPELSGRIGALAAHAEAAGAVGVLFTCSAFGPAIEAAARRSGVPVPKPNEAMFDAAFSHGDRIALVCTFAPAVASMVDELEAEARRRGRSVAVTPILCEAALAALHAGDADRHDRLIAEAVAGAQVDAILLAQFSMARAAPRCRTATRVPVLTSPETAVARLQAAVEAKEPAC